MHSKIKILKNDTNDGWADAESEAYAALATGLWEPLYVSVKEAGNAIRYTIEDELYD